MLKLQSWCQDLVLKRILFHWCAKFCFARSLISFSVGVIVVVVVLFLIPHSHRKICMFRLGTEKKNKNAKKNLRLANVFALSLFFFVLKVKRIFNFTSRNFRLMSQHSLTHSMTPISSCSFMLVLLRLYAHKQNCGITAQWLK